MAERRPTIADVAHRVGVSKTLVSFVFNDRPGVAPETRERILAAAKEMGWRPRPSARSLSIRRSFALGLVVRRDASVMTADSFFPAFIAGVETVLADEGQVLVLSVVPEADRDWAPTGPWPATTGSTACSSPTCAGPTPGCRCWSSSDCRPSPWVGPDSASPFPCVNLDDSTGSRADGRSICWRWVMPGSPTSPGTRRCCTGCAGARPSWRRCAAAGLRGALVEDTDFSATAAARATDRLLERHPRPTAIVYASDPMAVAGLGVIQAAGCAAPTTCRWPGSTAPTSPGTSIPP